MNRLSWVKISSKYAASTSIGFAFESLAEEGIISGELALKLRKAKGMRNIIAHKYAEIDDEMVFHAATEELINDVGEFIDSIKREI